MSIIHRIVLPVGQILVSGELHVRSDLVDRSGLMPDGLGQNHEGRRLRRLNGYCPRNVGAVIGGYLMRLLGSAGSGGMIYTIVVAVIGAVILTWVVRLVMGNKSAL